MYRKFLRVVSMALCLVCFVCFVSPRVDAVENIAVNLMDFGYFTWYEDGVSQGSSYDSYRYCNGATAYKVSWDCSTLDANYDHVFLCIESNTSPSSVYFYPYGSTGVRATAVGASGRYWYYRVALNGAYSLYTASVVANYASTYTGRWGLVSCNAYKSVTAPVTAVGVEVSGSVIGDGSLLYENYASSTSVAVPYRSFKVWDTDSASLLNTYHCKYTIADAKVRCEDLKQIVFELTYAGVGASFGVSYGSGNYVQVPVTVMDTLTDSVIVSGSYEFPLHLVTVVADFSDIDLSGLDVVLDVTLDPSYLSSEYSYVECTLGAVELVPEVSAPSFLSRAFTFIGEKLDRLTELLSGSSDAGSDEFMENAQNQADSMAGLAGELESMQKPDVDSISGDISGYVPVSDMQMLTSPLTVIFRNDVFGALLMAALTLMLGSYILFGRK